ncbi:xylulokinase [Bacillus sp. SORGH_AS 510]|uniref:xylulokinase n=1 Tax=Bacillus sp. SORGH_AS_0510 TaxID=3041771 RepID=UPI00278B35F0|nr:xylulokinase [Bacillus sp. SORGH_AS_0510]MDQ1143803.1 xylulokinase [Bacillus sp. SORGH_AS_0510]
MNYVIGIDLGTGSVKAILVNEKGKICGESSASYPLIHEKSGYSEQNPEQWVIQTISAIQKLLHNSGIQGSSVEGISFSGQMHGLVLLDEDQRILRNAILWNDTRTTAQCRKITKKLGDKLETIAKNPALEGFTLPKLLWVKENEPEIFKQANVFLLPKDYVRYRFTGQIAMDYSDAAGTLLLDVINKEWSPEILKAFSIPKNLCPALVESTGFAGNLLPEIAEKCGLSPAVKVFAGGADNACGAIGAGILSQGDTLCSIGTSGVILSHEESRDTDYNGKLHFFNHCKPNAFYGMGVTLAAGYSLTWFKDTFANDRPFQELLEPIDRIPAGSAGLLFTPYLTGERTPHADSIIRGSFIGIDSAHTLAHFTRAVIEGITFSLRESLEILKNAGKSIQTIVSIGGGAKNETWLQIQADVFQAEIVQLESQQGPALGAAIIAAVGCNWFETLEQCTQAFVHKGKSFYPNQEQVFIYEELYNIYRTVYQHTLHLNRELAKFRNE